MRSVSVLISVFLIFSCTSKNVVLTKKEFAEAYRDSLRKKYPAVNFELNADLTITAKKDELDFRHYIDNAYVSYQAEPDSIKKIIGRYVASTADLFVEKKGVKIENIVPVVKPAEYLKEINSLNKDAKGISLITEKYNDQLIIAYAQDSKSSIKYLSEDDFKLLSISRDSLKSVALRNFDKIIPNIQRQGDSGLYIITAGGDYEASLILLSSIWTEKNFPVDGELIIAIPNRDLLMVTGSQNKKGIDKIKEFAEDSYKTGNYPVSEYLFKWTGKRFEKYN